MHAVRRWKSLAVPAVAVVVASLLLAACNANGQLDPALMTSDATVVARDIAFAPAEVRARAGQPITLTLDNADGGIPHGIAISRAGSSVATSEIITGPGKVTLNIPPLAAGSYQFICPVHPNMTGTLVVAP
jgi:plastocyanin